MDSLLNSTIRWYVIFGVFLYVILFAYYGSDCLSWYNVLVIYTFASFAMILWCSANWAEEHISSKNLGITIFAYSIVFVTLYLLMSDFYVDNTFLFSEADARHYEKGSFELLDVPFEGWVAHKIKGGANFDDWGASMTMSMMLHIIPSKLFVNFCYILLDTLSGLCLFKMGKTIMTARYAYVAALSYAISSYSLFFMGSFLKEEIMVTIVIISLYFLCMYRYYGKVGYLICGGFFSILVLFFRPAVAIFIWASFMVMLYFKSKNGVFRSLAVIITLTVFIAAFGLIQASSEKYTGGGEVMETYESAGVFQKAVLVAGALIGPFPQLLQIGENMNYKGLYGAGLFFKLMLMTAFWTGLWHAIRHQHTEVLPIYMFVVAEMLGLSVALDGLELRKSMPHVPLSIVAAFWYLDTFDNGTDESKKETRGYGLSRIVFGLFMFVAFFVALAWNTLKVK